MVVWSLTLLLIGLPASASDEAQVLTKRFRTFDRYARVFTMSEWDRIHRSGSNNVTHRFNSASLIGHIQIHSFDPSDTCSQTHSAIINLVQAGAKTLELDLRGNRGGHLMTAVCVTGLFVGRKRIIGIKNLAPTIPNLSALIDEPLASVDDGLMWVSTITQPSTDLPVTVHIDRNTASSAEIVPGVLQEYGRGNVVGETSYGKAMAQECAPMKSKAHLILCYTAQAVVLPSGRSFEGIGITPNISRPDQP